MRIKEDWYDLGRYKLLVDLIKIDWFEANLYDQLYGTYYLKNRLKYIDIQWSNFIEYPLFGDLYKAFIIDGITDNLIFQLSSTGILV